MGSALRTSLLAMSAFGIWHNLIIDFLKIFLLFNDYTNAD
jgi:hypothetical protein